MDSIDIELAYLEAEVNNNSHNIFKMIGGIINKVFGWISSLKSAIINKINDIVITHQARKKLRSLYRNLHKLGKNGTIDFIDVFAYEDTMSKYVGEMRKVCKLFLGSNGDRPLSPTTAKMLLKKANKINGSYQNKIEEIKSYKVKLNAMDVLKWLDANLNRDGNIIGIMSSYEKELYDYRKKLDNIEARLVNYANDNGIYLYPQTFGQVLINAGNFVNRNMDWISAYVIAETLKFISNRLIDMDIKNIEKILDEREPGVPHYGTARGIQADPRHQSTLNTMSNLMGYGKSAMELLGSEMFGMSRFDGRNHI